jgi:hypothetical protein
MTKRKRGLKDEYQVENKGAIEEEFLIGAKTNVFL